MGFKEDEKKVMNCLFQNNSCTIKEISKETGIEFNKVNRIYNRILSEGFCSRIFLPNYGLIGYNILIIQRINVRRKELGNIDLIRTRFKKEWVNCLDIHETFDGLVYIRSVWKSPEDFSIAKNRLHEK